MAKQIVFLKCGEAATKSNFIQHVHDLHHVALTEKDTFKTMFEKMELHFKDNPEGLAAAKQWIAYNREDIDPKLLDSEVLDVIPDPGIKLYAIFDLQPER